MNTYGSSCISLPSETVIARFRPHFREVLEAILKGAKRRERKKIVSCFRGKEVAFVKQPCRYFLVTVYWITK